MKLELVRVISEEKIHIGTLEKTETGYKFYYSDLHKSGQFPERYLKVRGFNDFDQIYESEKLFGFFNNNITPRNREDFGDHIRALGMETFDEWEYLKITGIRSPLHTYELVENL